MKPIDSLGQFEQVVLTAAVLLGDDAYGVSIHRKVQELYNPKPVLLGGVYVTLDRLEDKGLLTSRLSKATQERGGRAKRCYQLLPRGEQALQNSRVTAMRVCAVLEEVWGDDEWNQHHLKGSPARPK